MKYRSPSPDNVLPTPPQSPTSNEVARSAAHLLSSLESFYQQERYWVHHTRAALELSISKGIDAPPRANAPSPASSTTSSSSSSLRGALSPTCSAMSDLGAINAPIVKMEPEPTPASLACPPSSRWMRRKNVMRLKIDGIAVQRKRRPVRASHTEPGARLLEMFSELMDARMESCQRVQRMVRNANRADLYMR